MFNELVHGAETEAVKDELKWLTGRFGPARDLDVLIEGRASAQENGLICDGIAGLAQDLAKKRDAGFEEAKAAVASDRNRQSGCGPRSGSPMAKGHVNGKSRTSRSASAPPWPSQANRNTRSSPVAQAADYRQKTALRARFLRPLVPLAASVIGGNGGSAASLKGIETALGTLNGIEVHKKITARNAQPPTPTTKQTALAIVFSYRKRRSG